MNLRLRSEIQRLNAEKQKLENILGDPSHRASCHHTRCPSKRTTPLKIEPPMVIITDTTETPSCSPSSTSSSSAASLSDVSSPLLSPPLGSPPTSIYKPESAKALPSTSSSNQPGSSSSCASGSSSHLFLSPKYHSHHPRHNPYRFPASHHRQLNYNYPNPQQTMNPVTPRHSYSYPQQLPQDNRLMPPQGQFEYPQISNIRSEFLPPAAPPMHRFASKSRSRAHLDSRYTPYRAPDTSPRPGAEPQITTTPMQLPPLATTSAPLPTAPCQATTSEQKDLYSSEYYTTQQNPYSDM